MYVRIGSFTFSPSKQELSLGSLIRYIVIVGDAFSTFSFSFLYIVKWFIDRKTFL